MLLVRLGRRPASCYGNITLDLVPQLVDAREAANTTDLAQKTDVNSFAVQIPAVVEEMRFDEALSLIECWP
ncbi:MAG: hypothetical protein HW416_3857 [Chloroflexi bacterium]|nr:hypothetical protein [Chloroflexota bacterium]